MTDSLDVRTGDRILIRVLGPVTVEITCVPDLERKLSSRSSEVITGSALEQSAGRLLLALLAVEGLSTADALSEALWPVERPRRADRVLAGLISRLRHLLGAEALIGDRHGYRLADHVEVDLHLAAKLVAQAARRGDAGEPGMAGAAASSAVDMLEQGPALAEEPAAAWADATRQRQADLLARARRAAAQAALQTSDVRPAIRHATAALTADPLDEVSARLLMRAHSALGRPAEALRVYERLRMALAAELAVEPAPQTLELVRSLRAGQPGFRPQRSGRTAARRSPVGPLAGRDAEVDALQAAWERTTAGHGDILLLTGPPGVGKTRLAEQIVRIADATGGRVLASRCFAAERSLFLQPMVEALGQAAASVSPGTFRAAVDGWDRELAELLPDVLTGSWGGTAVGSPEAGRRQTFAAVAHLLSALSASAPVLLFLDDLHEAGRATVELVHYLHRTAARCPLLVVGTVRAAEGRDQLTLLEPVSRRLDIGALPDRAVAELAAAAGFGDRWQEVHQRTAGLAVFVVEVLRAWRAGEAGVPPSLQVAVELRLEAMPIEARRVLQAGAILGSAFDPLLAGRLGGLDPASALAGCRSALTAGLITAGGSDYEFANDLIREAVYEGQPAPARTAAHRLAADLLADRPEAAGDHAAAAGDWLRAGRSHLLAGEQALQRFAVQDAAALAHDALVGAERTDDAELRGRALLLRGRAADADARYQQAWTDLTAAVEVAVLSGDERLEVRGLREVAGDVSVAIGRPPAERADHLGRLLDLTIRLGDHAAQADARDRLTVLACSRLDFLTAADHAARALVLAEFAGDDLTRGFALDARKTSIAYLGDVDAVASVTAELQPVLRRLGNLWLLQWAVFESAAVPLVSGDHDRAAELITDALHINRRSGYLAQEPWYLAHLAWVRRLAGDLDGALRLGRDAVDDGFRHGRHRWWAVAAAGQHATSLLLAGRRAEAVDLVQRAAPLSTPSDDPAFRIRLAAATAWATGDASARREAVGLLSTVRAAPGQAWLFGADSYLATARALLEAGDVDEAERILSTFRAAADGVGWRALVAAADAVG